jgi:polyvinyl alcohol dehydrogenase (cytochrome)
VGHEILLWSRCQKWGTKAGRLGVAVISVAVAAVAVVSVAFQPTASSAAGTTGDWPTYLGSISRRGFNASETTITPATAANLKLKWTSGSAGSTIFSEPIVVNGLVYWGSFDGYEHATDTSGHLVWHTFLGQTPSGGPFCRPPVAGVASTAQVTNIAVGHATSVLYVGGGDAHVYALDAVTGDILWSTRLGPSPSSFIWSSPAVFRGSVYIGLASFGDCPLVQGQLVQLNARTGIVQHVFDVVPNGCTGGGVWASPAIDVSAGTVYFATGNPGSCSMTEPLAESVVEVSAADLALVGSWSVPAAEQGRDGDFGATPNLFSYRAAQTQHRMVGLVNKNGTYYAFARDNLAAGPAWRAKISRGGPGPESGGGDIAPAASDGNTLYVAGGRTTLNGLTCQGVIVALAPSSGQRKWAQCLTDGPVLGAVTVVPGVVAIGEGSHIVLVATSGGQRLFSFPTGGSVWGGGTISSGTLYQGDIAGNLYALAP